MRRCPNRLDDKWAMAPSRTATVTKDLSFVGNSACSKPQPLDHTPHPGILQVSQPYCLLWLWDVASLSHFSIRRLLQNSYCSAVVRQPCCSVGVHDWVKGRSYFFIKQTSQLDLNGRTVVRYYRQHHSRRRVTGMPNTSMSRINTGTKCTRIEIHG